MIDFTGALTNVVTLATNSAIQTVVTYLILNHFIKRLEKNARRK